MRVAASSLTLFAVAALLGASACARPVLYYPTPESAGVRSSSVGSAPASSSAARASLATATAAAAASPSSELAYLRERHLLLPVAGADQAKLYDSFNDDRDGGERTHRAIDILAPRGTPILSADDGKILRMTSNRLGGITMYTVDPLGRIVYYYAHMDHYNDAMSPGREIVKGDTLGFVGTTGNAPKDTPHLHFQIMLWPADGKYWNGEPVDPYALLGGVPHDARR